MAKYLFYSCIFVFLSFNFLPITETYLHLYYLILFGLILISGFLYNPLFLFRKELLVLYFFCVVMFLVYEYYNLVSFENLTLLFWIAIPVVWINIVVSKFDFKILHTLANISLFFIFLTCILSIFALRIDPEAIRNVVVNPDDTRSVITYSNLLKRIGVGTYSFTHSIIFLIPIEIYLIRKYYRINPRNFSFHLVFLCAVLIYIFASQFTTILILSMLMIAFSFFFINYMKKKIKLKSILLLLIFTFALFLLLPKLFVALGSIYNGLHNESKMNTLLDLINNKEVTGDLLTRNSLRDLSVHSFLSSPFIGTGNENLTGRHNFIIDMAAKFGLILIIPFFLVYKVQFDLIINLIPKDSVRFYIISVLFLVVLSFLKNMYGYEYGIIFFFILPGLLSDKLLFK